MNDLDGTAEPLEGDPVALVTDPAQVRMDELRDNRERNEYWGRLYHALVTDPAQVRMDELRDNRERNEYWGRLYHAQLVTTGSKEAAREYACSETRKAFGSTPFAKRGDPRP